MSVCLALVQKAFSRKRTKKRRQISSQIEENGYKFRERYQVDPKNDSIKVINEILTFDEEGNIKSRAKIGNTRDEILSLLEYDLNPDGDKKGIHEL